MSLEEQGERNLDAIRRRVKRPEQASRGLKILLALVVSAGLFLTAWGIWLIVR